MMIGDRTRSGFLDAREWEWEGTEGLGGGMGGGGGFKGGEGGRP